MKSPKQSAKNAYPTMMLTTTLVVAVVSLVLSDGAGDSRHPTDDLRVAQGILVQPDAGELEPPAVRGEDGEDDGDDDGGGDGDDSGENVPAVLAPRPGVIEVVPAVPESRQEELERPGARQTETERGDARQDDLELPQGPGVKY